MGHLFNPSVPLGISTNKYKHVTVTSSSPRTDPDKYPVRMCVQTTCPVRFVDCHSGFLIVTMNSLTYCFCNKNICDSEAYLLLSFILLDKIYVLNQKLHASKTRCDKTPTRGGILVALAYVQKRVKVEIIMQSAYKKNHDFLNQGQHGIIGQSYFDTFLRYLCPVTFC